MNMHTCMIFVMINMMNLLMNMNDRCHMCLLVMMSLLPFDDADDNMRYDMKCLDEW